MKPLSRKPRTHSPSTSPHDTHRAVMRRHTRYSGKNRMVKLVMNQVVKKGALYDARCNHKVHH